MLTFRTLESQKTQALLPISYAIISNPTLQMKSFTLNKKQL